MRTGLALWVAMGAINALVSVAAGAFGAHARPSPLLAAAGWSMFAGIVLFSGLGFLAGWALLAIAVLRAPAA